MLLSYFSLLMSSDNLETLTKYSNLIINPENLLKKLTYPYNCP